MIEQLVEPFFKFCFKFVAICSEIEEGKKNRVSHTSNQWVNRRSIGTSSCAFILHIFTDIKSNVPLTINIEYWPSHCSTFLNSFGKTTISALDFLSSSCRNAILSPFFVVITRVLFSSPNPTTCGSAFPL